MRRRTALALFAILAYTFQLTVQPLPGQQPRPLASSSGSLASRVPWIRFEVLLGRFSVISGRQGNCRFVSGSPDNGQTEPTAPSQTKTNSQNSDVQETLVISSDARLAAVRYERLCPQQHLLIEYLPDKETVIQRIPRGDSTLPILDFWQHPSGRVRWDVKKGEDSRRTTASSLWHLFIAEPELCASQLVPIFETIRPNWRLMEQRDEVVERLILHFSSADSDKSQQEIRRIVEQLGDGEFRVRQRADMELRAIGLSVLPILNQLSSDELTAEQRLRMRRIQESYEFQTGDTTDRVSSWLLKDPNIRTVLEGLNSLSQQQADVNRRAAKALLRTISSPR